MRRHNSPVGLLPVLLFTLLGFAVMGYHPGAEDDGVYLTAVKSDLHPNLFPHDADFFRIQLQATQFDGWMAHFVRATGLPVPWAEMVWQLLSLFLILWACSSIARLLFAEARAQWAALALVAAMFTLPVAGTALTLVDQYLHPRALATALVLAAVARILAGKRWQAIPLLSLSFALHPIMAAFGSSFCFFLVMTTAERVQQWFRRKHWDARWFESRRELVSGVASRALIAAPLGWVFESPNPSWRKALNAIDYMHLYRWEWYEWLGALAPIFLFWLLWRIANRRGQTTLARFALAVFIYGVFQQCFAMFVIATPAFIRLMPLQPMRFLHLIYFFLALIGGGLIGQYLLKVSIWRWAVFLLAMNGTMLYAQRQLFSSSDHLELPGRPTSNSWLQAFYWIRQNTPDDAYFALGAGYMSAPGNDFHSFRALAERSELADAEKDNAVAAQVPELAQKWDLQVTAQQGWQTFHFQDFERLKAQFGVEWVLVDYPPPAGLICRWHNGTLTVCQIP